MTMPSSEQDENTGLAGGLVMFFEPVAIARRLMGNVVGVVRRVDTLLDDVSALRHAAHGIAAELGQLSASAAGIERHSADIAREITGLSRAAQGIDSHAGDLTNEIEAVAQLVPTLQRLTEIVDPLDNTVVRLGRLIDRLPGSGRRTAARNGHPHE